MCKICEAAMDAVPPSSDGPTADAWSRADAAIKAWRKTLIDADFDSVLEVCEAWCEHMNETRAALQQGDR